MSVLPEQQGQLAGKVVLVIGGAHGIGRGIVERCAGEGARVVIADLSPDREDVAARLAAEGVTALALPLDVRHAEEHVQVVAGAVARFGRIDAMVYSAGIFPRATLLQTDDDLWQRVIDINLTGAFLACRALAPQMTAQGGGSIVTIGSLHARRGSPHLVAYAASKGGLVTLTRNLAAGLAADRIRVNCVHPGWVMSEGEQAVRGLDDTQVAQFVQESGNTVPLGRMQTPDDIARMVAFLLSDAASQITGQIIAVDGGMSGRGLG